MEDLAGKITELLGNPEIMDKLKDFSGLSDPPSSENTDENSENTNENFEMPLDVIDTVMKLVPLLSSIKKEDKYTRFLKALRPLLSEKRRKKLDSSSQILQLVRMIPFLKNNGIIWGY